MHKRNIFILINLICILMFSYTESFAGTPQAESYNVPPQVAGIGAASYVPAPEIGAPSAILVEAESGQILYSKDHQKPLHISAACKLMTVLVAIENDDLFSNVTVSSDSVDAEGSALSLEVGAKYPLEDLLYAIMLTSANDAAKAVAEHVSAGNIGKFVDMMNDTAAKLNMTNTHFTNPTGLLEENQYTTASDISLLIKHAISNTTFNRIFSTKVRPWYGNGNDTKILTSSNNLFWGYDGIEGGKTGYNKKEQQTIVSTASRTNMKLICVVLDSLDTSMYTDASALFDYGFQNFRKDTLIHEGEVIKTAELDGNKINLISKSDITYVHPMGESYIKQFTAIDNLKPPLKKAIPAGSASYILQDDTAINISLYPESEVIPPDDLKTSTLKKVIDNKDIFYLVLFLIAIEAILVVFNIGKLIRKLILMVIKRSKRRRKSE